MNLETLFKITYGLYAVCSGDRNYGNGFISNTVFQVSSKPAKFAVGCHKSNYTSKIIDQYNCFSVSILNQETEMDLFSRLGYKSGKDFDKLSDLNIEYDKTGAPIILDNSLAYLECDVIRKIDIGTHWLFIGELKNAVILEKAGTPITYSYYREIKKLSAPRNSPTFIEETSLKNPQNSATDSRYKCNICGYIYDENKENIHFSDLSPSWTCPVCGTDKKNFTKT
jgi:flavin reductase (DIM6/NTAB) family NADH-FMN oxidoreductase RutF/rubredoxin